MQDNQTLQKIIAKHKLGLPLTDSDKAFLTLYADAAAKIAELCDDIIAPILDIIVPIIDAIALRVKNTSVEQPRAELDEYARKGAFVEKYLSPMLAAADMRIKQAVYRCNIATGAEYVDISYIGGYKRSVCVTADSLQALILDVMR